MKRALVWFVVPWFVLGAGCVRSHRTQVVQVPVPVATPPPVVYEQPEGPIAPPPAPTPPATPTTGDLAIAGAVKEALRQETIISSVANNVLATVQGGVVTLRGSVPSQNERIELVDRIKKTPGVVRVQDELVISGDR